MGKNKKLIQKIKKVWKLQEEMLVENHKKISKIIKDFNYKDLKEILQEEEIELCMSQEDLDNINSEEDRHGIPPKPKVLGILPNFI